MRKKYVAILCVSLAVLIVCGGMIINKLTSEKRAAQQYEQLAQAYAPKTEESAEPEPEAPVSEPEPPEEDTEAEEPEPKPEPEPEPYTSPVDFASLWEINPDVIGWITVPGTDIDHPILRSESDNGYYLTHDIYGDEIISASIYIENYNRADFSDFNTVVYGHNMNDGSMFGQLHRFEDSDFFDENKTVLIYLPDKKLTYRIFAARYIGDEHILTVCRNADPESCDAYIAGIFADRSGGSNVDRSGLVTTDDRIITLSTCDRYNASRRYVVHAVLEK